MLSTYGDFNPARGASFRTFAWHRIRGAVTRFIRPNYQRRRFETSLFEEVDTGRTNEKCELIETIVGEYPPNDRELNADIAAAKPLVRGLLRGLPVKHGTVIKSLILEQSTLQAVGNNLGCSKQRVCAIRSDALRRLKSELRLAMKFPLEDQEPVAVALRRFRRKLFLIGIEE